MKIGIVQRDDTRSLAASSGTLYFMSRALERHVGEVVHLGPDTSMVSKALLYSGRILNKAAYWLTKRRTSPIHQHLLTLQAARVFAPRIEAAQCDVLFAPFASVEIAALCTSTPIVYHTDMTWADAIDYYAIYSSLFGWVQREGERIQEAALTKARRSFFPSTWAARTAIDHYEIEASRIGVVPYGANFEAQDIPSWETTQQHTFANGVKLLWIGVNWERKGGDVAFECFTELLKQDIHAELVVCGCTPPQHIQHERLQVIPFLDKHDPAQRKVLSQLFLEASLFLFPTLTEAFGIVLCEASAHGLPSLATDTGGVSSIVTNGINGYLFAPGSAGKDYAARVLELLVDEERYRRLVQSSRERFEQRLNWDAWGQSVKAIFKSAMSEPEKH